MFTGIITDVGTLRSIDPAAGGRQFTVTARADTARLDVGGSIACAGVCLTAIERGDDWFKVDVSPQTLSKTTLGGWRQGHAINLERPLKAGDEFGGHLVLGHVDGVGRVGACVDEGDHRRLTIVLDDAPELGRYVAYKGSVAVDGVSLTVNAVTPASTAEQSFEVNVIPHTLAHTSLGGLEEGAEVNLEVDLVSRYLDRMMAFRDAAGPQ